jgi:hypothetical protein
MPFALGVVFQQQQRLAYDRLPRNKQGLLFKGLKVALGGAVMVVNMGMRSLDRNAKEIDTSGLSQNFADILKSRRYRQVSET